MGLARSAAKPEKSAVSRFSLLAEPRRSLCHTAVSFSKASLKKGSCVSRETVATTSTGSAMEWGVGRNRRRRTICGLIISIFDTFSD